MTKEINLEGILRSFLTTEAMLANSPDYTYNTVLSAMREACKQTLELAAEKAEAQIVQVTSAMSSSVYSTRAAVQKQSILNTINQVK